MVHFTRRDSTARVADGRSVTLKKVRFGKSDRVATGNIFVQAMAPLLPPAWTSRLGLQVARLQSTNDVLFAWFEFSESTNQAFSLHVTVADERGLESAWIPAQRIINLPGGRMLVGYTVSAFPRHSKTLSFRFYELSNGKDGSTAGARRVAELHHSNPAVVALETREAPPLPQSQRIHGEVFSLVKVNTGLQATGQMSLQGVAWTELMFQLGTNPPATLGTNPFSTGRWTIASVRFRSVEGNFVESHSPQGRIVHQAHGHLQSRRDDGVVLLSGALWPDESWKIEVEFEPAPTAAIPSTSTITFNGLPLPIPGITNRLNLHSNNWNAGVKIHSISAPFIPATVMATNRLLRSRMPVTVEARLEATDPMLQLRYIRAHDDRGSNVVRALTLPLQSTDYRLLVPRGATSLTLTLGVHRRYQVEFTAKPLLQSKNVAHWMESAAVE